MLPVVGVKARRVLVSKSGLVREVSLFDRDLRRLRHD